MADEPQAIVVLLARGPLKEGETMQDLKRNVARDVTEDPPKGGETAALVLQQPAQRDARRRLVDRLTGVGFDLDDARRVVGG